MPKLTNITSQQTREVKSGDNNSLKRMAEEIGTLFGCEDGKCGSCRVEIIHGKEHMSKPARTEKNLGIEEPYRLMCQCKIHGDVVIKTQ